MVKAHKVGAIDLKKDSGGELAGHIAAAHDHFNTAGDHMDDAAAHVGSAMSAWGHGTAVSEGDDPGGAITLPSLSELTEGGGPWYDSAEEYGEKIAGAIAKHLGIKTGDDMAPGGAIRALEALGKNAGAGTGGGDKKATFTQEQVDAMVKSAAEAAATKAENEALKKQVDILQRMPNGAPKVKIFDFDKSALPGGGADQGGEDDAQRLGKLVEGVDFNIRDEGDFTKAGSTMIANMIKNGPKFGKNSFGKAPMWDANFRGRGGTGARN
jgi:hypothetical protein